MAGYCPSCGDLCYLICDADLIEGATPLHQNLPLRIRRSVIHQTQVEYVEGLLGDCFDAICTAITNANLPVTDANYAAIDTDTWEYQELMVSYVKPLIVIASTLTYIEAFGFDELQLKLPAQPERDAYIVRLEGRIARLVSRLQTYLATNGANFTTPCNCPSAEEELSVSTIGGDWRFVTGYPRNSFADSQYGSCVSCGCTFDDEGNATCSCDCDDCTTTSTC